MDKTMQFHMARPRPAGEVVFLRHHGGARRDPALLAQVLADHPRRAAEDMLCDILEGMANWLDRLQQGLAAGAYPAMGKPAARIALVAGQIGLTDVAVAADHLAQAAVVGDPHALAAILGRLERAFDVAVTDVWDFRDL
ncbi:hypothetical protein [Yoonia sp.]|jgi:hypothetical protein|uniref:hypothetical protein n=1 Tax=Yoonia sp. TaxID=2212373 RepID=UPI00404846B8